MTKRIGVFICECGTNISDKIDVNKVIEEVASLEDVVVAESAKLLCSPEGRISLEKRIKQEALTHLVVAACSPRDHQQTFMRVCERAGMNPYLLQLANIREQCAWITEDSARATEKAIRMIRTAISRVRYHVRLEKREIVVNPDVLVVGGGIAGIEISLMLACPDRTVYLVEKSTILGGMARRFERVFPGMDKYSEVLETKTGRVLEHQNIRVLTASDLEQIIGFYGNFEARVRCKIEGEVTRNLNVGAVVLTIGSQPSDPSGIEKYGYGEIDNVLTALEFEEMNRSGQIALCNGSLPTSVAIVHCVGREEKGYCSEVCCMYALKFARYLRERVPYAKVSLLYSEMCIPGKTYQRFCEETLGNNVKLVRSSNVRVWEKDEGTAVSYMDEGGAEQTLIVDMVILAPAIEPTSDARRIAEIAGIPLSIDGFFAEQHEKLGPVATSKEGVFIAGCAQGPKSISDTLVQADAAAGLILSSLVPGRRMEVEAETSQILESFCQGCRSCMSVCSYGAITFDERMKVARVNEVICRGCGNCAASCPSGAASIRHSTCDQIYQEIMEATR